jgi:hypothetical protein
MKQQLRENRMDEVDLTPPSILFISTHDINPDLGCYAGVWPGAEYANTPNLDGLAAEGARYDMAFATTPVCAPSRSAIITGMLPTTIGTMHMRSNAIPPPEVRCFPEYLREAGYYCTNNFFTDFQFQPPVTALPVVSLAGGRLVADCSTEGVSIGWTTEPPGPEPEKKSAGGSFGFINMPDTGGRRWLVYSEPFAPPAGVEKIWFCAHQLGYLQSEDVAFQLNAE